MDFFGSGGSSSRSDSFTGLRGLGDTPYAPNNPLANQMATGLIGDYNSFRQQFGNRANNIPQLDSNGLFSGQLNAFNRLGQDMFSNVSSNYAKNGFLSPDNVSGVIGSALTAAAPSLFSQIGQNYAIQDSMYNNAYGQLNQLYNTGAGMLGSENHSSQQSEGPGIGYLAANEFFKNSMEGFSPYKMGSVAGGMMGAGAV